MNGILRPQCIALVEWYWTGHHPAYFVNFILALENSGSRVLAICPNPNEAAQEVSKLRKRWRNATQERGGNTTYLETPNAALSLMPHWKLRQAHRQCARFRRIDQQLRRWERLTGNPVAMVFYACIYEADFRYFAWIRRFLRYPWSGLYLHVRSKESETTDSIGGQKPVRIENVFNGSMFLGLAVIDERHCDALSLRIGRPVTKFPDMTDERMPGSEDESKLGEALRQFGRCRTIVGLFGHLQYRKGVSIFAVLGNGSFMGSNSILGPHAVMGDWAKLGAGSFASHSVKAGALAVGVPAKTIPD
jgi:hypothetical protein